MVSRDNPLWLQLWHDQQSDEFHQVSFNKYLTRFWPTLNIPFGSRIFVPLCGKSLDMLWLAKQGYQVIGVELSPIAVKAFFKENRLQPAKQRLADFTLWRHGNISILCGDYFSLSPIQLGKSIRSMIVPRLLLYRKLFGHITSTICIPSYRRPPIFFSSPLRMRPTTNSYRIINRTMLN